MKQYYIVVLIAVIIYGTKNINIVPFIESPLTKFTMLGLILYFAHINPTYSIYTLVLYFYLYNFSVTKEMKESFSHIEAFEQLEVIDSDVYNEDF